MAQISVLTSILLLLFFFLITIIVALLCSPGWPGMHYVDQAWPQTPGDWPASASYVMGLKVCATKHTLLF